MEKLKQQEIGGAFMTNEIRIFCNDGGFHEKRGDTNIIALQELDAPGLDGARWREVAVQSTKDHSNSDISVQAFGAERGTRETVTTPDGKTLVGVFAGRTRSRGAAEREGHDPDALQGSELHFDLRCSTCGLDVSVTGNRLDPLLDKLRVAGYDRVPLSVIQRALTQLQH